MQNFHEYFYDVIEERILKLKTGENINEFLINISTIVELLEIIWGTKRLWQLFGVYEISNNVFEYEMKNLEYGWVSFVFDD